jgi:hypothetical protein
MFFELSIIIGESCCTMALNKLYTCIFIIMSSGGKFYIKYVLHLFCNPKEEPKLVNYALNFVAGYKRAQRKLCE